MNLSKMIKLARKNGTYERVYGDIINKQVKIKYSDGDEIALLRKEVMLLRKEIASLKPNEAGTAAASEFELYNEYVENCKKEIKQDIEKKD